MLIKFTGGGRGGGAQVANYLTREEGRGHAPPEVVRGDMNRTRELIDSIERQWTYTHGVLSFAAEDAPTEAEQEKCMDMFERLAFAGLDREQYDITWVRHSHTESGRTELHFVSPRMELNSGRAMNIAPPQWEHTYKPLRDALNYTHGWARPDDPERALELQRAPERAQEGFRLREGREGIHEHLTALVAAEMVTDRAGLVQAVREAGLEVTREGKDYITVRDPESDERFRMKGRIYEKDWTYDRELDRALAPPRSRTSNREREDNQRRAFQADRDYQAAVERRAAFNSERYFRNELEDQRGFDGPEMGQSLLVGRADRDLADMGRLIHLALDHRDEQRPDPERTNDLERLSDLHPRGADILDRSRGEHRDDLHQQRGSGWLHSVAERGVKADERTTDSLRARIAQTVRDLGGRLLDRLGEYRERFGELAQLRERREGSVRSSGKDAERHRTTLEESERSLRRANEAHRGLEGAIRELGEASERTASRTQEMTRERGQRDWDRAMRSPSRGWER